MDPGMSTGQGQNSTVKVSAPSGLITTMAVFGALGLALWTASIGFMFGWDYTNLTLVQAAVRVHLGIYISIPVNAAMIYVTCRMIFLVNSTNFPTAANIEDLQQCVARMLAATLLGGCTWITSLIWFAVDDLKFENYGLYHVCNYGFVFSAMVLGIAAAILSKVDLKTPTSTGPGSAVNPIATIPSQAHINQAFEQRRR